MLHRKLRLALPEAAQSESIFQTENGDDSVSVAVKAAHELGLAIGWQAHQAA